MTTPNRRTSRKRKIDSYSHKGKERANNPPVGLVDPKTDPDKGEKETYQYDPHIDPQLQWAGKAERTSFEVPTVSLHVHERIDPRTIMEAVRKKNGNGKMQGFLFEEERDVPLRDAIEFYKHSNNWSNRLIAGDSLLVMNSLIQKESMAGKVQCVYIDPPYGIRYGSNFQPFVNKRDVKDGKDEDLTAEPEQIRAFRDTWELGIHSYLSYMRDRLLLTKELLTERGSVFVQMSDENVHHIREIMDEIFGAGNFISLITFKKSGSQTSKAVPAVGDYLIWYGKSKANLKFRPIYIEKQFGIESTEFRQLLLKDGTHRTITLDELKGKKNLPEESRIFKSTDLHSRSGSENTSQRYEFKGKIYEPRVNAGWRTSISGLKNLEKSGRLLASKNSLRYLHFFNDFPHSKVSSIWNDMIGEINRSYVVQTNQKVIQRCILMTTDPGDLVFDPTCGSGTTAYVAEQWGRRWITCDTSRVALTLAKQRLMTATFDYYKLAYPEEGVGSGFEYKKVPHITLKSIANNEPPATETLYDQPTKDTKRARVTGPFTYEAVPSPTVQPIKDIKPAEPIPADETVARSGETRRQDEWRNELLKAGIRGKNGQHISFSRVDPLPCHWLNADAETKPDDSGKDKDAPQETATAYNPRRVVIAFGPEHAPMEQRQVENAIQEARTLRPTKPEIIIFAAFQFDPEAAKDIDEIDWPGITLLRVQMNADMQTADLKKNRSSNESFWLIGQPDVVVKQIREGAYIGQWIAQVKGFDYFNTKTGDIESGDENKIAVWMLDTDYDGRSLYPNQVFFPMSDTKGGWSKLAKDLKAEIDEDLIETYRGTISLPFKLGENSRIAVKIVDDRGIESLKVIEVKG